MMLPFLAALSIFFSPNGGGTAAISHEISLATRTVQIQAYSFTSQPILDQLCADKHRGVDVRVILDKSWLTSAPKAAAQLSTNGIPILVDAKHSIAHNKVIIIDGATVITGSFNYTYQAEHQNAENIVVIKAIPAVAALYAANWQAHAAHSSPLPSPIPAAAPVSSNSRFFQR